MLPKMKNWFGYQELSKHTTNSLNVIFVYMTNI